MTADINHEEAVELLSWISNLELVLQDLQQGVIDLFVADDRGSRRAILEQVIKQRQIWLERPVDEIQKLIAIKDKGV